MQVVKINMNVLIVKILSVIFLGLYFSLLLIYVIGQLHTKMSVALWLEVTDFFFTFDQLLSSSVDFIFAC